MAMHDRIQAKEVTTAVNEARMKSRHADGEPAGCGGRTQGRGNHFRDAMQRCLDGLAVERMVEVVIVVVTKLPKRVPVTLPR